MNGEASILMQRSSNRNATAPPLRTITGLLASWFECDSSCLRGHKQVVRLCLLAAAAIVVLLLAAFLCALIGASFFASLLALRVSPISEVFQIVKSIALSLNSFNYYMYSIIE